MADLIGLEKLQRILGKDWDAVCQRAAYRIGLAMVDFLQEYPPSKSKPGRWTTDKDGNARPMSYYERGRGTWYPIMKRKNVFARGMPKKSKGIITGKSVGVRSVAGYRLIPTSHRLREKWTVTKTQSGVTVNNSAPYAAVVQNAKKQARLMKEIGWRTDRQAAQFVLDNKMVRDAFREEFLAALKK